MKWSDITLSIPWGAAKLLDVLPYSVMFQVLIFLFFYDTFFSANNGAIYFDVPEKVG